MIKEQNMIIIDANDRKYIYCCTCTVYTIYHIYIYDRHMQAHILLFEVERLSGDIVIHQTSL